MEAAPVTIVDARGLRCPLPVLRLARLQPALLPPLVLLAPPLLRRLRAGGAGIPAFFTRTGVGTIVADGKEIREFDGKQYVMERALVPEISLVKAYIADRSGNLIFHKTARNFNPPVAQAGKITVVEVEKIVETGALDPDQIHLPGIYVHRIVINANPEKRIEQRTVRAAK